MQLERTELFWSPTSSWAPNSRTQTANDELDSDAGGKNPQRLSADWQTQSTLPSPSFLGSLEENRDLYRQWRRRLVPVSVSVPVDLVAGNVSFNL